MATPSKPKQSPTGQVDLYKRRQELLAELQDVEMRAKELAIQQATEIRREVVEQLEEVVARIAPLVEQDAWSWRTTPELERVIEALDLAPKEAKPVEVPAEMKELIIGFLKEKPHGCTVDEIAAGIQDAEKQPRWKVGSLRPKMPVLVQSGAIKSKPNPSNLRQNIYFVE